MDERDYKAMNDELKSAEELANNWADEYYERESERTSIIMEKDEWLNRRYNFLTGYNRCKEDLKKQLKEKEEEIDRLKSDMKIKCNSYDHLHETNSYNFTKLCELQLQLTKSNEMNERLADALIDIKNWDDRMEDKWEDQGLRAISALKEYQNSKK